MRYSIFIITVLFLTGCNLGADDSIIEQTPTAPSVDNTIPRENVRYWQMLPINEIVPTADDIVLFEQVVLHQTQNDNMQAEFDIVNLEWAIQAMIDSDNLWNADNLTIESLMIEEGVATIRLNGTISAVGGAILSAVPTQFYLTIFKTPTIDSVLITLNGEHIENLGIANDSQARANDFIVTREILAERLAQ